MPHRNSCRSSSSDSLTQNSVCVVSTPAGTIAELFVVPAQTADGVTAFLVHPDDPGVAITPQKVSDGDVVTSAQAVAHLVADAVPTGSPVLLVGGEGLRGGRARDQQ